MNRGERFLARVRPAEDGSGCLLWIGHRTRDGYGRFGARPAHRWLLEHALGERIPRKLHVDHLCRNPSCVRPSHLEIVTAAENTRRSWPFRARKIRCGRGHALVPANLYWSKGKRFCRACLAIRNRKAGDLRRRVGENLIRRAPSGNIEFTVKVYAGESEDFVRDIQRRALVDFRRREAKAAA